MSRILVKAALPALAVLSLTACQNYFVKPNIIPTGYTYLSDEYKTIPSPEPTDIGYEYSLEKNNEVLQSMRVKAAEMLTQVEERNPILPSMRVVYVFSPVEMDAQSSAFEHALRDELRERDYILSNDKNEGLIIGYMIREPDQTEWRIDYGDLNKDHRDMPHYKKLNEYEPMVVDVSLAEGDTVIDKISAVYDLPMYGYNRNYSFKDLPGPEVNVNE